MLEPGSIRITNFRRENGRPPIVPGNEDLRSVIKGNMIIARVESSPSQADWSAFKCFSWTGARDPLTGAELKDGDPTAPMGVYTYPKPEIGQRGSTVARVICNRDYKVGRTESLFVAFDCVNTADASMFGNELL